MIPDSHEYLSFLMGAGTPFRGLLIPAASLPAYKALVRENLTPGFWNDILGRHEIVFVFKLVNGTQRELELSDATRSEIARLCSSLNGDPIEKTSDMPGYLAGNPYYRELIEAFHSGSHS